MHLAPDDPMWKSEILAVLDFDAGSLRGRQHDLPMHALAHLGDQGDREPPYSQVRAEQPSRTDGLTAKVTGVELDGEELRSLVTRRPVAKLAPPGATGPSGDLDDARRWRAVGT